MNHIEKLFEIWSYKHSDTPETRKMYCKILEYLCENCSEQTREQISSYVLDFAKQAEQNAYCAGFCDGFTFWIDVLRLNNK